MAKAEFRQFRQFAPQAYYFLWADYWKLDLTRFPYVKTDFDPSISRDVPFCVFDFDIVKTEEGAKLAMAVITYKSIFSKSSFQVVAYL